MQDELLRYKRDQKYLIWDTETEGLNLVYSRPWQIAWVEMKNGKIVKSVERLIRWEGLDIPDEVKKMTGFNQNEYDARAEDPLDVWNDFAEYLYNEDYLLVGQNILGFDVFMLSSWCRHANISNYSTSYLPRCLDTLALELSMRVESKPTFDHSCKKDCEERLAWQLRMINEYRGKRKLGGMSQKKLLEHYNIEFDEKLLHEALYDTQKCGEIFFKQLYQLEI